MERRGLETDVELRAGGEPVIVGYAAMYDSETVIAGMFREQIAPGAFRSALAGLDDVRALFNHDSNIVLGRLKSGTLRLTDTPRGLRYEVVLNSDDPEAMRVRAMIQRGDVSGSSFGFTIPEGGDVWDEPTKKRDLPLRTITKLELFDVSPVTYPAYPETSVTARTIQDASEAQRVLRTRAEAQRDLVRVRIAIERAKAWGS